MQAQQTQSSAGDHVKSWSHKSFLPKKNSLLTKLLIRFSAGVQNLLLSNVGVALETLAIYIYMFFLTALQRVES